MLEATARAAPLVIDEIANVGMGGRRRDVLIVTAVKEDTDAVALALVGETPQVFRALDADPAGDRLVHRWFPPSPLAGRSHPPGRSDKG